MRTISGAERTLLGGTSHNVSLGVFTLDASGATVDLTNFLSADWVKEVTWGRTIDTPVVGLTVRLAREHGAVSLAPLMSGSSANSGGPLLDMGRPIWVRTAVTAAGVAPVSGDWREMFRGVIDDIDPGDREGDIVLLARDQAGALQDATLGAPPDGNVAAGWRYGDAATPLEYIMRQVLRDGLLGNPLQTWPGIISAGNGWTITTTIDVPGSTAVIAGAIMTHLGDTSGSVQQDAHAFTSFGSGGVKTFTCLVGRDSAYASHRVGLYDFTTSTWLVCLNVDFTSATPVVSIAGGFGTLVEVTAEGSAWRITAQTIAGVNAAHANGVLVIPAGGAPADTAYFYAGDFRVWDNPNVPPPLAVPASPGWSPDRVTFAAGTRVWDILQQFAASIGWWCMWMPTGTSGWELRLFAPPRSKTTPDDSIPPSEYLTVTEFRTSRVDVRNDVTVEYIDAATGYQTANAVDAGSIATFGRRRLNLGGDDTAKIRNATAANTLAAAVVADLALPPISHTVTSFYWWPVELADLYTMPANGVHYDAGQNLAVVGFQHTLSGGTGQTSILMRGKPAGAYARWVQAGLWTPVAEAVPPPFKWTTVSSADGLSYTITWDGTGCDAVLRDEGSGYAVQAFAGNTTYARGTNPYVVRFKARLGTSEIIREVQIPAAQPIATLGGSMNGDPLFEVSLAWQFHPYGAYANVSFKSVTDAPAGRMVAFAQNGDANVSAAWLPEGSWVRTIPVDPTKTYRVSGYLRAPAGGNRQCYIGPHFRRVDGTVDGAWTNAGNEYYAAVAVVPGTGWTRYEGQFGAGTPNPVPASARWMTPQVLFTNAGGTNEVQCADLRIEEVIPTNLIKDQAVTNAKVLDGTLLSGKFAIVPQQGNALNSDPGMLDPSAWDAFNGIGYTLAADPGAPFSGNALVSANANGCYVRSPGPNQLIPLDANKTYRVEAWVRRSAAGDDRTCTLLVAFYDSAKNPLVATTYPGQGWLAPGGTYHYFGIAYAAPPTYGSYTKYEVTFGPAQSVRAPSQARFMRIGALLTYSGTTGTNYLGGMKVQEVMPAELIVDGAITARKLSVGLQTQCRSTSGGDALEQRTDGWMQMTSVSGNRNPNDVRYVADEGASYANTEPVLYYTARFRDATFQHGLIVHAATAFGTTGWTGFLFWRANSTTVQLYKATGVGTYAAVQSFTTAAATTASDLLTLEWNNTLPADGTRMRLYANGVLVASITDANLTSWFGASWAGVNGGYAGLLMDPGALVKDIQFGTGTTVIRDGSVTARHITVAQLSAITADIGAITAGTLTAIKIRSSEVDTGYLRVRGVPVQPSDGAGAATTADRKRFLSAAQFVSRSNVLSWDGLSVTNSNQPSTEDYDAQLWVPAGLTLYSCRAIGECGTNSRIRVRGSPIGDDASTTPVWGLGGSPTFDTGNQRLRDGRNAVRSDYTAVVNANLTWAGTIVGYQFRATLVDGGVSDIARFDGIELTFRTTDYLLF